MSDSNPVSLDALSQSDLAVRPMANASEAALQCAAADTHDADGAPPSSADNLPCSLDLAGSQDENAQQLRIRLSMLRAQALRDEETRRKRTLEHSLAFDRQEMERNRQRSLELHAQNLQNIRLQQELSLIELERQRMTRTLQEQAHLAEMQLPANVPAANKSPRSAEVPSEPSSADMIRRQHKLPQQHRHLRKQWSLGCVLCIYLFLDVSRYKACLTFYSDHTSCCHLRMTHNPWISLRFLMSSC